MTEHAFISNFVQYWQWQQEAVADINRANGWYDGTHTKTELIMLMVTEAAEAVEALRHGNKPSDHIPAYSGEVEELADLVIRVMDYAARYNLPIAEAIEAKTQFNRGRGYKHGKQF